MRDHYTSAQFVKGLREARNEERERILAYLTKQIKVKGRGGTDLSAAKTIIDLIEDIKAGEHER